MLQETELQVHLVAARGTEFGVYFQDHWCAAIWPDNYITGAVKHLLIFFLIVMAVYKGMCFLQCVSAVITKWQ